MALCHRAAGSPDELRVALSAAPYIAHFGLHAEFSEAQVLGVLLGAGEVEAAIELSRGETKVCVSYQRSVLRHVVERSPGVGGTETGGQAALLAVTFNPQKKATCPIPAHMWTMQDAAPIRLEELGGCKLLLVDSAAGLREAEAAMAPLLAEAAAARAATDGSSAASEQGSDDAEVDEEEAVLSRFESAKGRPMIGLDTESPPVRRRGAPNHVAWLQLASVGTAALFDLAALAADTELAQAADKLLTSLFEDSGLIKLGQSFGDDLRLLKRGYPAWGAWRSMRNLLDVSVPYREVVGKARKGSQLVSLAKLSAYALGRPMCAILLRLSSPVRLADSEARVLQGQVDAVQRLVGATDLRGAGGVRSGGRARAAVDRRGAGPTAA